MAEILLLDDDSLLRMTLAELLEDAGFTVHALDTGAAALALCAQGDGDYVLVADRGLATEDGHSLAEQALTRWPKLRVIYISGAPDAADRHLSARERMLLKPFTLDALMRVMRDLGGH